MPIETRTRLERLEALADRTGQELLAARRSDHVPPAEVDRLRDLAARVDAALAEERRIQGLAVPVPAPVEEPARELAPSAEVRLLAELGVSARDVKEWAVGQGLLTAVRRGRVALALVEAYAAARSAP